MSRSFPIRVTGVALVVLVTATVTGAALAYFSTSGAGNASAKVNVLSAPTISGSTPGGGTVALTWSAVTAPGAGAVTYSVTRDGGQPGGDCPTSAPPASVTACTDSGVEVGAHIYTVTARWRSWSATSAPASANVTTGAATHFALVAASSSPAVGVADNLTITALDASDNTVTTYAGSHSLTFSGASKSPGGNAPTVSNSSGTVTAFGAATAIAFTSGVAKVSTSKNGVMKLYNAGATAITVSDGSISNPTALAVTVAPGAASKLSLAAPATVAGVADDLTTTALDTYGNTATTYTGLHSLTFSGAANSPGGTAPTIANSTGAATNFGAATAISFSAGVATVSESSNGEMKLYKSGTTSITASDGSISTASALSVTVTAAAAVELSLVAASITPTAGASDNLTTTALDTYGNTATTYTGSHSLTFSGAANSPGGNAPTVSNSSGTATAFGAATAIAFTSGVARVSSSKNGVMKLYNAGATAIAVSDGSISNPTALAVTVAATSASKLAFTNVAISAGSASSPCLFTCTVTGLGNSGVITATVSVTDTYGNTVTALGGGHSVKVTTSAGTISGGSLAISSSGAAESTTQFTFTAQASSSYSDKITAATSAGTTYTSASVTASR